ncbi:MAG: toxic anion resistance protein, partial [Hydrogenophaga sp.]|nr:toxic anion resistance protein [Hydrogenophaga sp.]
MGFQLTPPEVIEPVGQEVAKTAVPLPPAVSAAVEDQVDRFLAGLLTEDLQSESFRAKLDSAFALGREEVSVAASLMQCRFMERNFMGMESSPAFKA